MQIFSNWISTVGFILSFMSETEHPMEACGRRFDASHQGKAVSSRNHPHDYPDSHNCEFDVVAPQNQAVFVVFEHFSLEEHAQCNYDYLEVSCRRSCLDSF